jgi:protein-disulfide isomerase
MFASLGLAPDKDDVAEKRVVMNPSESRPTKNQKRQEARDKARTLREAHSKKSKRNKVLIQSSLAVSILAVIAVIAIFIVSSLRPPGPGPANMQSDGIKIGAGFVAVSTPALAAEEVPTPSEANPEGIPAIDIFIDYSCPACAQFESLYGPLFRTWLENGTATVEYHPLAFRDAQTAGTRYATRAGNSVACVAEHSPNTFFQYSEILLASQPVPPAKFELTDVEMVQLVELSRAENIDAIEQCIKDETFANWVSAATARAMSTGPLPVRNSEIPLVMGTPTVLVNGKEYQPEIHGDLASFVASLETSE